MQISSLGYHDVVEANTPLDDHRRVAAAHYALDRPAFRRHLEAIGAAGLRATTTLPSAPGDGSTLFLTFDDGAAGAYGVVAEELERLGWRGFFFVTTDWIAQPGFMSRSEIAELRRRGHVIGTHTRSHPRRMSSLGWEELVAEWDESREVLCDLLGETVEAGSVADGYYSKRVARAAASVGLRLLFNSEPTTAVGLVDECRILGRYSLLASSTAEQAAALATGRGTARLRQWAAWQAKKVVKAAAGEHYLAVRRRLLSRTGGNPTP